MTRCCLGLGAHWFWCWKPNTNTARFMGSSGGLWNWAEIYFARHSNIGIVQKWQTGLHWFVPLTGHLIWYILLEPGS